MNRRFQLNSIDMMTFLIQAMIGIRLLSLPREVVRWTNTDGWSAILLGGMIIVILAFMMYWLGIQYPGKNGSEIVLEGFGRYVGTLGIIAVGVHVISSMGLALYVFTSSLKLYLLPNTPNKYIMATILF